MQDAMRVLTICCPQQCLVDTVMINCDHECRGLYSLRDFINTSSELTKDSYNPTIGIFCPPIFPLSAVVCPITFYGGIVMTTNTT